MMLNLVSCLLLPCVMVSYVLIEKNGLPISFSKRREQEGNVSRMDRIKRSDLIEDIPPLKVGELPPMLVEEIEEMIQHLHNSFTKTDGESLELRCSNIVTKQIFEIFPKATFRWTLNNKEFGLDPSRMIFMNGVLVFQEVFVEDSGLYVCEIEYYPKKVKYVTFYSLVVSTSETTIRLQATKPFELQCPSQFIGKIHSHSFRTWLLNGTVYKKLYKIPAEKTGADVIPKLLPSMSGVWTCEVREPMNGKAWPISFYNLLVDQEPPVWQKSVDAAKQNIIPIVTVAGVALAIVAIVLLLGVYTTAKKESDESKAIDALKDQMVNVKVKGIELDDENDSLLGDSGLSESDSADD